MHDARWNNDGHRPAVAQDGDLVTTVGRRFGAMVPQIQVEGGGGEEAKEIGLLQVFVRSALEYSAPLVLPVGNPSVTSITKFCWQVCDTGVALPPKRPEK